MTRLDAAEIEMWALCGTRERDQIMKTEWQRERLELYDKLERSADNGLNREAVLASRELFDVDADGRAVPKEFAFQHEDDAVTVVCAEIPQATARQWGSITKELLKTLRGDAECDETHVVTDLKDVYTSDQEIMHVTLFYTSHPDDLAPRGANEHKSERFSREIALLRELAAQFEPIRMTPVKVVLAASGAILLLMQCFRGEGDQGAEEDGGHSDQKVKNAGSHAEFGVDLLRQEAQETFPFVSKKSPSAIIHTTLARVLSPDVFDEAALTRVLEACQRISRRLGNTGHNDANAFVVDNLWYVDESHFIRPTGNTTIVPLGS